MVRKLYPWMFLLAGVLLGLVASGRIVLHAQERSEMTPRDPGRSNRAAATEPSIRDVRVEPAEAAVPAVREAPRPGPASVQDVLLRPFRFPFSRPTSLAQVCIHLKQTLGVPVVLDIAALERQEVDPEDTVQLELEGVRLKTGLKLLLDQVGLTFHVVPEDNLLIITDREGSEDPLDRIWTELRSLHRDLHDVQDVLDDLIDSVYGPKEEGPRVRKPTIIEEKPEGSPFSQEPADGGNKEPNGPDTKSGNSELPIHPRGARPTPTRVPLAGPRRPL
jgi:hypothetical protein